MELEEDLIHMDFTDHIAGIIDTAIILGIADGGIPHGGVDGGIVLGIIPLLMSGEGLCLP